MYQFLNYVKPRLKIHGLLMFAKINSKILNFKENLENIKDFKLDFYDDIDVFYTNV